MIERLERVVPEAPGRPGPLPIVEVMQQTTRDIAFTPGWWTRERATQIAELFDQLAPTWRDRMGELREDALSDALRRGDLDGGGVTLEVGSGTGNFTERLKERMERVIALDISLAMLRLAPAAPAPRVCADAAALPFPDASASTVVLVNCFLFGAEVDRVLAPGGAVVWVSTLAHDTPIYLSAEDVAAALPGEWSGRVSDAGWGSWAVLRRAG